MSALGQKRTFGTAIGHVRFTPNSDRESGFPHKVMSALLLKADMCAAPADVGYGPIADIDLFDHLVGSGEQRRWHCETNFLGGL